ncbi:MAG: TetR/AcrR family transcriptional regulator [Deltaproteobacteria bacterium]|nr:TetR/AcrR family transcriptional regulator [Deltaproteobacteria bacterium]
MASRTTRIRILDCAEALFAERGFAGTRTRDIAELVGVNTALIHYYFDTKEKLLASVIDRIMTDLSTVLSEIDLEGRSWEQRLEEFVGAYFDYVRTHPSFPRLTLMAGGLRGSAILEDQISAFMGPLLQAGVAFVREGAAAGRFHPLDPEQLVLSLYCATVAWFSDSHVLSLLLGRDVTGEDTVARRREHLIELAFRAVGASRPRPHQNGGSTP